MRFTGYRGEQVAVADEFDSDGDLNIVERYLPRDEVARLRDHLTAVLGDGPKEPAPEPVGEVEVGREYQLLPDSKYTDGYTPTSFVGDGVTRVRVTYGPDADGDVRAEALDGADVGYRAYVDPKYLVPLDPTPPAAPDAAKAAREVAESHMSTFRLTYGSESARAYSIASAFTQFADKLEGKPA